MPITKDDLKRLKFKLTHECVLSGTDDLPVFARCEAGDRIMQTSQDPMVYFWLSPNQDNHEELEVLYVGKAGLGVTHRLKQHMNGFRNSSTGKGNRTHIVKLLKDSSRKLLVYARRSDAQRILGLEATISLYSVEEEALQEAFNPVWNRAVAAGKASRRRVEISSSSPDSATFADTYGLMQVLRGQLMIDFYDGLDPADKDRLRRLLAWALRLEASMAARMKVVRRYSDQTEGYAGPAFLMAPLGPKGHAKPGKWILRIPLRCDQLPLTVVLNASGMSAAVREAEIVRGPKDNFRPKDLDDFLQRPDHYTDVR